MRTIFAFLMTTLDGYHEAVGHHLSWHTVDAEFRDFASAQLDEADTLLFGRATYEHMAAWWPTPEGVASDPVIAAQMNGYDKVVVSTTLTAPAWGPATVLGDDAAGQLRKLKEQPGKDIALIGSSTLAASLLGAGVLDELRTMINPVALGGGRPVLAGAPRTELELTAVRRFGSGNVLLTHRPRQ